MKHELYTPSDFTPEEAEVQRVTILGNDKYSAAGPLLYTYVVEQGLDICKSCGAVEGQLADHKTCEDFRRFDDWDTHFGLLQASGVPVVYANTPCCSKYYGKSAAPEGWAQDTICKCPHCGKRFGAVVTSTKLELSLL